MIDIGGKPGWNTTTNERSNENELSKTEKQEKIIDDFSQMLTRLGYLKPSDKELKEPPVTNLHTEKAPINNLSSSPYNETTSHGPRVKQYDELNPYRTSTKRPPINNKSNTTGPLMDSYPVTSTTTTNKWLTGYMKEFQETMKSLESSPYFHQERIPYNTPYIDYNTRAPVYRNTYHYESFTTSSPPTVHSSHKTKIIAGVVFSIVMVVIIPLCRKWCSNTSRRGSVQYPGVVVDPGADMTAAEQADFGSVEYPREGVSPGAAQQHIEPDMTPPGQAEAVPPYIEMPLPYCDRNKMNVSEPLKDSEPLPHNNGLVEIGFRNECVAMTTTVNASGDVNKEFVSDNDRTVERLSVNETAHGIRHADDRDNVKYVDEKSMPNQRAKYTK